MPAGRVVAMEEQALLVALLARSDGGLMYQIGTNPNTSLGGSWPPEPQPTLPAPSPWSQRGDGVASGQPGWLAGGSSEAYGGSGSWLSSASSGLSGIMSSFSSAIQTIFAQITSSLNGTSNALAQGSSSGQSCASGIGSGCSEQGYASATASSLGDPHLSFDGTTAAGTSQSGKWDNMQSHGDLLDSDSFGGGYQISTTATAPSSNGVTFNERATVSTDGGATAVTFANGSGLTVTQNGQAVAVAAGQSVDLGNGEIVTSNTDGSATVSQSTGSGGSITTNLKTNGSGVDVSTTASNVDLGGYLVTGRDQSVPISTYQNGTATSNAPVGYVPIYADPETLAGGSWNAPELTSLPATASSGTQYGTWTGVDGDAGQSSLRLTGFSEPSIESELD